MPKKNWVVKKKAGTKSKLIGKTDRDKLKRLVYKCNVQTFFTNGVGLTPGISVGALDINVTAIATGSAGTPGTQSFQRSGNAIKPRKLRCNYIISFQDNTAGAVGQCFFRWLIVQGTENSGQPPALNHIFEDATSDTTILYSGYNNDYVSVVGTDSESKKRPLRVLYDTGAVFLKNGAAPVASVGTGTPQNRTIKRIINGNRMREVEYNGPLSTNFANTPIYIVSFCDATSAAHPPIMFGESTIWYDNVI